MVGKKGMKKFLKQLRKIRHNFPKMTKADKSGILWFLGVTGAWVGAGFLFMDETSFMRYSFFMLFLWIVMGKKVGKSDISNDTSDEFTRIITNMMLWIFAPIVLTLFLVQSIQSCREGEFQYEEKWFDEFTVYVLVNMTWLKKKWIAPEYTKQELREKRLKKLLNKDRKWWQRIRNK